MRLSVKVGVLMILLLAGCDNKLPRTEAKQKKTVCIEPSNPYNDGGGHDAGFNWARENGGDCNGSSDSFNEGCAEFYRQLNQYNDCIVNSK